jgi:hypothetical protein
VSAIIVSRPNPDCESGKHAACSGTGWDFAADRLANCTCVCHARIEADA